MITSTSSSSRNSRSIALLAWASVVAVSCRPAGDRDDTDRSVARVDMREAFPGSSAETVAAQPTSLQQDLQVNFDRATGGKNLAGSRIVRMPRENSAGIGCEPPRITREHPRFIVELPERVDDRKGVLAAITPRGELRIIYISYSADTDEEDILIPSYTIDWKNARRERQFIVDTRRFDALVPEEGESQPLFRDPGIYQFAIMNSHERAQLELDGRPFRVKSGCLVEWNP